MVSRLWFLYDVSGQRCIRPSSLCISLSSILDCQKRKLWVAISFSRSTMYMQPRFLDNFDGLVLSAQLHTQNVCNIPTSDFKQRMELYNPPLRSNGVASHTHAHVALDRV